MSLGCVAMALPQTYTIEITVLYFLLVRRPKLLANLKVSRHIRYTKQGFNTKGSVRGTQLTNETRHNNIESDRGSCGDCVQAVEP